MYKVFIDGNATLLEVSLLKCFPIGDWYLDGAVELKQELRKHVEVSNALFQILM